ncbi:hypothetical protein [Lachnoclostridium sp.]|uniref:hypothetical protein n=1 Tax=Lachnoclostridium sp. TaxID=2028282 RepID=UPI0028997143|nr:hypothetical protein [Lachnoclostridium sp.]
MSDLDESNVTNETPGNPIEQPEFETVNAEEPNLVVEHTTGTSYSNIPNEPKKNKRTAGIIALVAGIAACIVIAIFAVPRIIEAVSRSSSTPKERFESAVENYLLDEAKSYEKALSNRVSTDFKNSTISVDFNVTLNNMLTSMIKQTDPEYFADLKLDNIGGNFIIKNKEDKHNVDVALSANDTKLLTVESYFENAADSLLFRIPELSSDYLSTPLNLSALEDDASLPQFDIESYQITDAKELTSLLTDTAKILTNDINDVSLVKDVNIVASDVSATYDKLTAKISEQDTKNILIKLMKRVYDVESYKNLLDTALLNSDSVNTFDELISTLETAEASDNTVADFSIFVDKKNELHGCEISMTVDGSNMVFSFLSAKGNKNGIEFFVAIDDQKLISVTSNYTKASSGYQGFIKLFVNELDSTSSLTNSDVSLTIDFENVKVVNEKKGHFTGSFNLTSPQLSGTSIELTFGVTGEKQDVTFNVSAGSMSLFSLTASYQVSEGAEIVAPSADAKVYDTETEMDVFMSNSFMGLLEIVNTVGDTIGVDLTSMMYGM